VQVGFNSGSQTLLKNNFATKHPAPEVRESPTSESIAEGFLWPGKRRCAAAGHQRATSNLHGESGKSHTEERLSGRSDQAREV